MPVPKWKAHSKSRQGAIAEFMRISKEERAKAKPRLSDDPDYVKPGPVVRERSAIRSYDAVAIASWVVQAPVDNQFARYLRILFGTGMRESEGLGVRYSDLKPFEGIMQIEFVRLKHQGRIDMIPADETLEPFLWQWLNENNALPESERKRYLINRRPRGRFNKILIEDQPFNASSARRFFVELQKKLGLSMIYGLHEIRHTVGTWLAQKHGEYRTQLMLGHNSGLMTRRYMHPAPHTWLRPEVAKEPPLWWLILKGEKEPII
jgi:integrase